jgi:hypothetical protein
VIAQLAVGGGVASKELAVAERGHGARGVARPTLAKAMAQSTNSAGGFLVEREVADEVLRSLRAQSAVLSMPGVRRIEVNSDELVINAVSSGGAAAYTSENAAIPVSEMTFSQSVLLKPTPLTALIPVPNVVLRNALANPDLDGLLRSNLVEIVSLRADLSMLRGAGVAPEPLGLTNMVGTASGLDLGANGGYLSLPQVRAIASIPRSMPSPCYLLAAVDDDGAVAGFSGSWAASWSSNSAAPSAAPSVMLSPRASAARWPRCAMKSGHVGTGRCEAPGGSPAARRSRRPGCGRRRPRGHGRRRP